MVNRVRVQLDGFRGAPGVATFYGTDLATLRAALTNLWGGLGPTGIFPANFTATIATSGDIINSATGAIEGTWVAPAIAPSGSGGSLDYAGPAGATITWLTNTVADGSRVRGRTFLVPGAAGAFDSDGTLKPAVRAGIEAAAANFVAAAAPTLVVWHRPRLARPATATLPALAAHGGSLAPVTGSSVPDRVQILRSRRD